MNTAAANHPMEEVEKVVAVDTAVVVTNIAMRDDKAAEEGVTAVVETNTTMRDDKAEEEEEEEEADTAVVVTNTTMRDDKAEEEDTAAAVVVVTTAPAVADMREEAVRRTSQVRSSMLNSTPAVVEILVSLGKHWASYSRMRAASLTVGSMRVIW
jgi:hypothetical protein